MPIFFYLFATLITISSLCVVLSKNSVYSVLWLIFAFINGAGLMILLGAEFLAMMLIVIYVGAVAVLFLFVIMMLDTHFNKTITQLKANLALSIFIALIMFADLVIIILLGTKNINFNSNVSFVITNNISNTKAIGGILYTDFMLPFQMAGLILFVAMIACITLTLKKREGVKRQDISKQLRHNKENTILMTKPILNKGVENIKYE
ncbi:NADH:ubiquinone oxidoreductase subunit J [Rickettsia conorii subsp. heilongjiangensis]|uniref:NADH-quinone oxidoreductase subunit J n=1 Tax=Rickettsia conorii subsp. heilongjiangensis TaxID=226665 RepID=A0AAD1GJS3_RICCR|nr:NADH-quinone oxidoreductase subunit J [Rickettsia conorii]AEK75190.1 NADH:ubiquinone oxidoreductase subunit J [Rickettsia conorii subsp. heilongjiangensis 054]BBM91928.1 NADH:ubiquinone oxidoreductase subunit J [Rickettsia conorii subsp. heilongjiangensis]BBM93137.1 NADH:ubiquinone oxidoreductase subunit J [Rickettsia conorii subsp. heilongjiangensis]BBM94346.1 NADH:ubiquinone oxidoreductase subunit J [Rickettsia conorii subsp. heilongjiangensis]BBM95555.1 NADH:ubiquinone oxidoreductase sub